MHKNTMKLNQMKISQFQKFICAFPFRNQSFDIKRANWKVENQQDILDKIFDGQETVTINRYDLINSSYNTKEFVIKTLMWGYPTKGRGRNIDNLLIDDNLERLIEILDGYKEKEITIERLKSDIKSISGLGISSMTKFTNFLNTTVDKYRAVIFDKRIIDTINSGRFEEFNHLQGINSSNAINYYPQYLKTINDIAKQIGAEPEQIEIFLFTLGKNLSKVLGENCYDYD